MKKSKTHCAIMPTGTDEIMKASKARGLYRSDDALSLRELEVCGTGEVTVTPDQCTMTVTLTSTKDSIQEANNSIKRRLDYVVQTLKNHQVKESELEVYRNVERNNGQYSTLAEVVIAFHDMASCEVVHNLLVEKLDDSVKISEPLFFCSALVRENARCRSSALAVHNAKMKAGDMARQLGETVGDVLAIREDTAEEQEGSGNASAAMMAVAASLASDAHRSVYRKHLQATVVTKAKVTVLFQLKSKS